MGNTFRNTVIYALEMSRRSKVPVLFISGPGFGKTTSINSYAKKYGYHVESVIGSQYAKDEILGYLVNEGGESLTAKEPEWFSNIMSNKKNGKPSILFLDEISAASTEVQGSLLQVCFERKIRGGKSLPDDTIICAAANYKLNLPGWCDIMSPSLNRFCIINLQSDDDLDLIEEFTQDFEEVDNDWPEIENLETDGNKKFVDLTRKMFSKLFKKYPRDLASKVGQTIGALNLKNQCFDGMYCDNDDGFSPVLNFISGRTMSYTTRLIRALYSMGMTGATHAKFISLVTDGIIGLGTNTWSDNYDDRIRQINSYRDLAHKSVCDILNKCAGSSNIIAGNSVIYSSDLQGRILETMNAYESGDEDDIEETVEQVVSSARVKYSDDIEKSLSFLDGSVEKLGEFTADFEAMMRLNDFLKENYDGSIKITNNVMPVLKVILKTYSAVYQSSYIN